MRLSPSLNCSSCNGVAMLSSRPKTMKYEGFVIHIDFDYYYKCVKCGEEFTTTSSDMNVYNQIRAAYKTASGQ